MPTHTFPELRLLNPGSCSSHSSHLVHGRCWSFSGVRKFFLWPTLVRISIYIHIYVKYRCVCLSQTCFAKNVRLDPANPSEQTPLSLHLTDARCKLFCILCVKLTARLLQDMKTATGHVQKMTCTAPEML